MQATNTSNTPEDSMALKKKKYKFRKNSQQNITTDSVFSNIFPATQKSAHGDRGQVPKLHAHTFLSIHFTMRLL
jgi:hypothetical protein